MRGKYPQPVAIGQRNGSPLSPLPCNNVIGVGLEGVIHGDTATSFLVYRKCRDRLSPYRTKCSSSFVPIMLVHQWDSLTLGVQFTGTFILKFELQRFI